jgi:hypothetical protein
MNRAAEEATWLSSSSHQVSRGASRG